jgi:hypothetical protein
MTADEILGALTTFMLNERARIAAAQKAGFEERGLDWFKTEESLKLWGADHLLGKMICLGRGE